MVPLLEVLQAKEVLGRKVKGGEGGVTKKEVKRLVEEVRSKEC